VRVVLDTNVFVSAVFFIGPPYKVLQAWRDGRIQIVLSPEILEEYQRVGVALAELYPGVELDPILDLLTVQAQLITAPELPEPACQDPDDDKFLACALGSRTRILISGDKHLLKMSGYRGIEVVRPREFLSRYL
jgi:putative PIN family toxin of toxin-antitoxin system